MSYSAILVAFFVLFPLSQACITNEFTLVVLCTEDGTVSERFGMQYGKDLILRERISYMPPFIKNMQSLESITVDSGYIPCSNITEIENVTIHVRNCQQGMN